MRLIPTVRQLLTGVLVAMSAAIPLAQGRPVVAMVEVHVRDADTGLPIARVRLTAAANVALPPTLTDDHGDALIDPRGIGTTVRAAKPGYATTAAPLPKEGEPLTIVLPRGAAVSGRLTDPVGLPVAGVDVRVALDEPRAVARAVKSDDLGEYRIGALAEGRYVVTAGGTATRHLVNLRRGSDVGGIDFAVPPRNDCRTSTRVQEPAYLGGASIRGRLTTTDGKPIACADVRVFSGGARVASISTGTDGRYALTNLRAGTYGLEFSAPGFVSLQLSQQQSGQPGRLLRVRDREEVKEVNMALPRSGAMTGTVFDEFYDPIEGAEVHALELRGQDERVMGVGAAQAATDDRGRYRLSGLPPGRYFVVASAAKDPADAKARDPKTGKGLAPVYYPGTSDIGDGREVTVLAEREQPFIDFARLPTRVQTVSGKAVNSAGEPVTGRVILVASQRSGAVIAETHGVDPHGESFDIPNVPPGDYVVQVTSDPIEKDGPKEFGMAYVIVNEVDPPPVMIRTQPTVTVSAKLIQEGALIDPHAFGIAPVPTDYDRTSVLASWRAMTIAGNGGLTAEGLSGTVRFTLVSGPDNWFLKAVKIRGGDFTNDPIDVRRLSGTTVELVVSAAGASLSGTAGEQDSSVLLFSTNPSRWYRNSAFVKTTRSDGGRFRIEGMPEGEYYVVALDPLDGSAVELWHNRAALQALIPSAQRVRLKGGEARTISLAVTRR